MALTGGGAGIGGQGLGCWLDDVVNRDESSSGGTDGLGMHPAPNKAMPITIFLRSYCRP
jgi:hypothetical protein